MIERLLDSPNLPTTVARLQPDVLHRIIERCGLEDCGPLISLASPTQIAAVFDLDLWRSDAIGQDEQFDADRFGTWLEVMVSEDIDAAARTLASLDAHIVSTALAAFVSVFDLGTLELSFQSDDDHGYRPIARAVDTDLQAEIGGYRIVSKRDDAWDAIVDVLIALDATHQRAFHDVLRRCRRLSNDGWERDGLDELLGDDAQSAYERAGERQQRRERQGYVSAADARAFLQQSRDFRADSAVAPDNRAFWRRYIDRGDDNATTQEARDAAEEDRTPAMDADGHEPDSPQSDSAAPEPAHDADAAAARDLAAILELLADDEQLGPRTVRGLLEAPEGRPGRLQKVDGYLRAAHAHDAELYARRAHELSLLANTLLSGSPLQSRRFTPQEASDAAVAVCNLGLENWPSAWPARDARDLPVTHDLFVIFQVGMSVLHQQVCVPAAERLVSVLDTLASGDTDLQEALLSTRDRMTKQLRAGTPWVAADALDVVMSLDVTAWASLVGLIAPFPVIHEAMSVVRGKGPRRIDPTAFAFIAENDQLAFVDEFLAALQTLLQAA